MCPFFHGVARGNGHVEKESAMNRLQKLLTVTPFDDRFFDSAFRQLFDLPSMQTPFPALNLWEDGDKLIAEAEVPGLKLEDIELLAVGTELTIKGRRPEINEPNVSVHRHERGVGEFSRTITLPMQIDSGKVEATLRDGVLTIVLPKAEPARARKIPVKPA
jgi:HSP20 family protein